MKLAIITSNHLRHQYFVTQLAKVFSTTLLVVEEKKRDPSKKGAGTELQEVVVKYFDDRDFSEQKFFGDIGWEEERKTIEDTLIIPAGSINEGVVKQALIKHSPDYVCVFGSSIIGEDIISLFPNRIINMHLGLSPFYRGSGTNFWPLYEEKLDYIGVTIHYLDKGIDSGKIIAQTKPVITTDDTPHSIGNKTIIAGVDLLIEILHRIENGEKIEGEDQNLALGRVYLFKECTAEHIAELVRKCEGGLISNFVEKKNRK